MFFLSAWHRIGAQSSWSASARLLFTRSHTWHRLQRQPPIIVLFISLQTESQFEVLAGLNSLCRARWSQIFGNPPGSSWVLGLEAWAAMLESASVRLPLGYLWSERTASYIAGRAETVVQKVASKGTVPHHTRDLLIHPWFIPVWGFTCVICGAWGRNYASPIEIKNQMTVPWARALSPALPRAPLPQPLLSASVSLERTRCEKLHRLPASVFMNTGPYLPHVFFMYCLWLTCNLHKKHMSRVWSLEPWQLSAVSAELLPAQTCLIYLYLPISAYVAIGWHFPRPTVPLSLLTELKIIP